MREFIVPVTMWDDELIVSGVTDVAFQWDMEDPEALFLTTKIENETWQLVMPVVDMLKGMHASLNEPLERDLYAIWRQYDTVNMLRTDLDCELTQLFEFDLTAIAKMAVVIRFNRDR